MHRKLVIYSTFGYAMAKYEYIKCGERLMNAGIHINYLSSMRAPSVFEIETNNVRILFMPINRFYLKGYHFDEIFGDYSSEALSRRKNPNRPLYEGDLLDYIKEIENGSKP